MRHIFCLISSRLEPYWSIRKTIIFKLVNHRTLLFWRIAVEIWGTVARRALEQDPKANHDLLTFCKEKHKLLCSFQVSSFNPQSIFFSGNLDRFPRKFADEIHIAAFFSLIAVATILFSGGADINAKVSDRRTPLHVATTRGNETTMEPVLGNGAAIDTQD